MQKQPVYYILLLFFLYCPVLFAISGHEEPVSSSTFTPEEIESRIYRENTAADAHYNQITDSELHHFLTDPEFRIDPEFKVPPELIHDVQFWLKIYAKYSMFQVILYDKLHPEKVYDVIDVKDLFKRGKSEVNIEVTQTQKVTQAIARYKSAFDKLISKPKISPEKGGPYVAKILSLWGSKKANEWREIKKSLRSQTGQRDRMMEGILNADPYFPSMEAIFRKFNLPIKLTRIPLVESSFNLNAMSKADAVGAWQFLERSAKEYLIVDRAHKIDERLSPVKSSYAAAKMFQRNIKLLGDLGLAIIAYNHGPRNLLKIKHKYRGERFTQLLKLKKNNPLGYASRNYYSEFIAALYAESYKDVFYSIPIKSKRDFDTISIIKIGKSYSIFDIASQYNISIYDLKRFNPDIFDPKISLPKGTRVVIPRKVEGSIVQQPTTNTQERVPAGNPQLEHKVLQELTLE